MGPKHQAVILMVVTVFEMEKNLEKNSTINGLKIKRGL